MVQARVRYDPERTNLVLNGEVQPRFDDEFLLYPADLGSATLVELRDALRRSARDIGITQVDFISDDLRGFDHEYVEREPVSIELIRDDDFEVTVQFVGTDYDPNFDVSVLERLIAPAVARSGLHLRNLNYEGVSVAPPYLRSATFSVDLTRRTVLSAFTAASRIGALLQATNGGLLDRNSIRDLALGGYAQALLGQRENEWFDAKTTLHDLKDDAGKLSLATDVAAFANAEAGGILVYGLRTRKTPEGEYVDRVSPMKKIPGRRRQILRVIDQRIVARPEGVRVETVDYENGELLLIDIPPQPAHLAPFLTRGSIQKEGVVGEHFGYPVRRDDQTAYTGAAGVHSMLAAGRALLRGASESPGPAEKP